MWVILMRLLGRTSTPSLNHFPVTLSSDTSHLNIAWSVALTVRSAMSCSTSSCFSKCTIWKPQENSEGRFEEAEQTKMKTYRRIYSNGTLYFQLSFGMPSICPSMVHSNVIQRGFLDDQCVFLPVFLKAVLWGVFVFVKLDILKEPVKRERLSMLETFQHYKNRKAAGISGDTSEYPEHYKKKKKEKLISISAHFTIWLSQRS